MKDYTLSKEEIAELEKLHRSLRDKRQAGRAKAVIVTSPCAWIGRDTFISAENMHNNPLVY